MKKLNLIKAVDYVRKNYFPRWDRTKTWVIKYVPDQRNVEFWHGICLKEVKKIYLALLPENNIELYLLLIHEICHAFYLTHEDGWQRRMLKAAEQAAKNGDNELSMEIIKQVDGYRNSAKITAQMVYDKVFDAVLDAKGNVSFESIRSFLAKEYGNYKFPDSHKKLRTVYERSIKDVKKMIKNREELRKKYETMKAQQEGV
jgi:hypothetical protein